MPCLIHPSYLLVFATRRSHFVFDGQYYDQVDGVAMGSPLGPVLANIFMCHFEEIMNSSDCPNVWFRYVDDTFTLFRNKDTAIKFLHYLNSRHDNIQFTIDFENNQQIPFLDVSINLTHLSLSPHLFLVLFVAVCP